VLLPQGKGEAVVESKSGRTEVDAKFERVDAPTRFGREYLTYVLWAVTPDGHAKNLGELLTNHSDKGHLRVTTDLQSFGLIVTAEPYAAVRLPSDVVVMENQVRPDTVGDTQPINVKYELMPRGAYTYTVPVDTHAAEGPKLSMDRYEALVEVYQAQNAVQIAQSQGAADYAPEIFSRAQQQLQRAQQLDAQHADRSTVVTAARQAAETAEDARSVAMQRSKDEQLAKARDEAASERQKRLEAEAAARRARAEASAQGQTLAAERNVRRQAEGNSGYAAAPIATAPQTEPATSPSTNPATAPITQPATTPATTPAENPATAPMTEPATAPTDGTGNRIDPDRQKLDLRVALLNQLNGPLQARDTPRGLVVIVPDSNFRRSALDPAISGTLARIASLLAAHRGLSVAVEGYCDSPGAEPETIARERAEAVRDALVQAGLHQDQVIARGLGSGHPIAPNAGSSGRQQNRRVEIIIAGPDIGSQPYWDKSNSPNPR